MDYSKLNRLKDELKDANSASRLAEINEEIEKEKKQIIESERQDQLRTQALIDANVAQKKLAEKQLEIAQEQYLQLSDNYNKLEDMFHLQSEAYKDARKELERSRRFNRWMMAISIIAMLAAIIGAIATILATN